MRNRFAWGAVAAALLAAGIACGGSPTSATQTATLSVSMKDSPFSDALAVLVTISEVSAHTSGGGWFPVPFTGGGTSRTCDLKQLTNVQDILGTGQLPAGHYTQIRFTVSTAAIYFETASVGGPCAVTMAAPKGRSAAVDIPSGQIILNREFDLVAGSTTSILLDFDGDKSISQIGNGSYKMSPVISIVTVH